MPDREKVLKGLEEAIDFLSTETSMTVIDQWVVRDAIAMLKAQVHGQWVDEKGNPVPWCDALPSSPAYSCWCNQCGTWLVASDEYPVYGLFCPVCGAKMDGERR